MRKHIKVISIILFFIFVITTTFPALAEENDFDIQSTVSQIDDEISSLNSTNSVTVSNCDELLEAINDEFQNIYITEDIQLTQTLEVGYDISFHSTSNEILIYSPESSKHIQITAEDILLSFDGVILDGNCSSDKETGGGIEILYKNAVIEGAIIKNCSSDYGSAIYYEPQDIDDLGSITIYNCTICDNLTEVAVAVFAFDIVVYNCTVENNEGGLSLGAYDYYQSSNVYIYKSKINNNSYYEGAGIGLYWSNAYFDEDTVISNNTSSEEGGGVYLVASSLENHATITNNSAYEGGGIYAYDNSEIINYSDITYNTSSEFGGGVALDESDFSMESGEVSYNSVPCKKTNNYFSGGGICIYIIGDGCNVTLNGGSVSHNAAVIGSGIGFCVNFYYENISVIPKITINGGTISYNGYTLSDGEVSFVSYEGGGILGCDVTITGGNIEYNTALYGAGIKTENLTMTDGHIDNNGYYQYDDGEENILNYYGGGIYTFGDTQITGGSINSNKGENGAGLYIVDSITLTSPTEVKNNIASNSGGGIYYCHLVDTQNTDFTTLSDNSAKYYGDQYYLF